MKRIRRTNERGFEEAPINSVGPTSAERQIRMNYRILSITVFSERKEGYEAEKRTEEAEEERRKKERW